MNTKKNILLTLTFLFIVLSSVLAQSVKNHGQLKVEGTQLLDSAGKSITLRGMSFGWHNWWPRFYNAGTVNWLADDWKCTVLRAAMGVEPSGAYLTDSAFAVDKVKAVVNAAIEKDLYVIIDWHSHNLKLEEAKAFFAMMAQTYGSNPHVIYEIFNEPDDNQNWLDVKNYSIEVINTIRAIDPDNIILVGSPHWDQDIHLVADDPILGQTNIMYTLHFYAATHGKYLRDRGDYALEKGIPLFVSESAGMYATGDGAINYKEWNDWIDWMEHKQISWINWSIADKDETCSVLKSSASSTGNWTEDDLKESGIACRNLLRKYYYGYGASSIYKALNKGRKGENIKIGVIGGSITEGYAATTDDKRWANLMADWWKQKFPSSTIELINAGWGGTGSDIGVHRVYDDLLIENPDFIVIEFAVNDTEGELATKMMEGLVQQIIESDNSPGVMILALKQDNGTTAQVSHKLVSEYYGIPLVSFADLIDAKVAEDGIALSSIFVDGLHPNDLGMNYIADFIKEELDDYYATLPPLGDIPDINIQLPTPLVTDIYKNTHQIFSNDIIPILNSGWTNTAKGWESETSGAQIDFKILGNAISLIFTQTNGTQRGKAEVWVDEGPKTIINAYMNEDWGTRYAFTLVEEGLDDGDHILHVKTLDESSTDGNFVEVTRLLVAGNIGSADPIAVTSIYQKGVVGYEVILDATESYDPDGESISEYNWVVEEKPQGSTVSILNSSDSIAKITPDVAGDYSISLVVASGFNKSVPIIKVLNIRALNSKPVALAGNDTLSAPNKYFRFDGTQSYDEDGDELSFFWEIISMPEGSTTYLRADNSSKPQTKFDLEGNYTISLMVYDSIEYSDKTTINVTVKEGYTGFNQIDIQDEWFKIYPNPTTGFINIEYLKEFSCATVDLYSNTGAKIANLYTSDKATDEKMMHFNLNSYVTAAGVYFIRMNSNAESNVQQITLY